jgi:hypothetical protein
MLDNATNGVQPPQQRSIRDLKRESEPEMLRSASHVPQHLQESSRNIRRRRTGWTLFFVALFVVVIAFFGISTAFSGADITVNPRQETVRVDSNFTASASGSASSSALSYQILSVSEDFTDTVAASGSESVEDPATGEITIYNNFDDKSLMLVANTRFQTSEGLVYRIHSPVTVPGLHIEGDKKVPGQVTAKVWSDQAGEKYNIAATKFTVPGLEGDPRFDAVWAESSEPMTGGFVGERRAPDEAAATAALANADAALQTKLLEEVRTQVPAEFTFFPTATFLEVTDLPNQNAAEQNQVQVGKKGTMRAIVFNTNELARAIASTTVDNYDDNNVTLGNTDDLIFSIPDQEFDVTSQSDLTFNLTGPTNLIWVIDTDKLVNDLSDTPKRGADTIFKQYPGIAGATVELHPFWKRTIPASVDDITLKVATTSPATDSE